MDSNELDELYLAAAKTAIRNFAREDIKSGSSNISTCMEKAIASIKKVYKEKGKGGFGFLTFNSSDARILDEIGKRLEPRLMDIIHQSYLEISRRYKVFQLNRTTASIIIETFLRSKGYTFRVEYQKYQAKVYIKLNSNRNMRIYIPYKEIHNDDLLDRIPETANQLLAIQKLFGKNFEVSGKGYL